MSAAMATERGRTSGRLWAPTLLVALAPAVWGSTYVVTTELLPPDRPLLAGTLRALPAGLIVLALTRQLPTGSWWWRAAVLGALNIGAFFALLFVAAYRLPGGAAATLGAAQPLLVAALAYLLLRETPTMWRLAWGVAGVAGIGLVVLRGDFALDALGVTAGLAGTASMAAGIVLTKRWGRPVPLLVFTGWQLTAGGLLLAPLALLVEGPPPALDASAVIGFTWLAGVGTLFAYALWFRGIEHLPVTSLSFLSLLSPLVATILGWVILGESLGTIQLLGFALALASIVLSQLPSPARIRSTN